MTTPLFFMFLVFLNACLKVPTATVKGISFQTNPVDWPEAPECIAAKPRQKAKEIMEMRSLTVLVNAGENAIPDEQWPEFNPGFGHVKNTERHLLFNESCFVRSPSKTAACNQNECLDIIEHKGWTWAKLARIESIDCMPNSRYCNPSFVPPSHLASIVIQKCHQLQFSGKNWILKGPNGEKAIMHATADGKPTSNVALPTGWRILPTTLTNPLILRPFGDGNDCYFTILRDHQGQSYHMFHYPTATWPSQ